MDTDTDPQPDSDDDPNRYLNVNRGPTHPDAKPFGLTVTYDGTLSEPKPHPLPDFRDDPVSFTEPDLVAKPGDAVIIVHGDGGTHRFTLTDAHGRWLAHGTLSRLDFHVESLSRGSRVLPVRAEPDALPEPQPGADRHVHTHKHAHHAHADDFIARTGLVIQRYDHAHRHAHAPGWDGRPPDDRSYHDDHEH